MSELFQHAEASEHNTVAEKIRAATAVIPDYPQEGVRFIDITTVLRCPEANLMAFTAVRDLFDAESYDIIVSPESRGWLFGQSMALALRKPHVIIRKPGKLPRETASFESTSEYDTVTLEVHAEDIPSGSRILIVDDVLATCGTALAITKLIHSLGAEVIGIAALYELLYLPRVDLPCPALAIVPYTEPPAPYAPPV